MSSPVAELLVQDSVCVELFKSLTESIEANNLSPPDSLASLDPTGYVFDGSMFLDDVIGHIFGQMIQILPPEERHIFDCTDEKNIDDIIQEANELIRTTTPLFSSTDSGDKSVSKSSKALPLEKLKTSEYSSNKECSEADESAQDKSDGDSIFSSLESILVKETMSNATASQNKLENPGTSGIELQSSVELEEEEFGSMEKLPEPEEVDVVPVPENLRAEKAREEKISSSDSDKSERSVKQIPKAFSEEYVRIPKAHQVHTSLSENSIKKSNETKSTADSKGSESLEFLKQKHNIEIQELKISHSRELQGFTEHIHILNNKVFEMQRDSKAERSPEKKDQEVERLQDEVRSQEQLISGYERENRKLCKEILALKESWKQKESKLIEEKQRLQNELQGMVSKCTTEALEEQLKDARETIVKLQIELTTHKSKNKELEVTCERLRAETHKLQTELSNCQCNRTIRRDKYSFLASSNQGSNIQELKNVISRKDGEIAQLNTTLSILKGELNNRDLKLPVNLDAHNLTISQLQAALVLERQMNKDLLKEKDSLSRENLDLKRQVRELESIVKRRQKSDSCFPVSVSEIQTNARLVELEKELSNRQESMTTLHNQFVNMQKKYEDHIQELEQRLKECKEELQTLKATQKKEEASLKLNQRKVMNRTSAGIKEDTHLLATIRGLRQDLVNREKEISKLNKEVDEVRQTNRRLQKEREKQLNALPVKMTIKDKANLKRTEKSHSADNRIMTKTSPNNNSNTLLFTELQETNLMLSAKIKSLQGDVKKLEQDLITMHNKRLHDLNTQQREHELEVARLVEERAALLSQTSATELQGQIYTQQMVINHLKNKLKQMEELKNEVTLLRAERDHLEESLAAVNKKMCFLQNAQSPESGQYKTLLEKLENVEKNLEMREQKLNAVRELLCRSTQGQGGGQCSGTCRDKLLDKNRQICYYRAQMDRILEALLEIRRTK